MSYSLTNQFLPALADIENALAYKANFPLTETINYEASSYKLQQRLLAMKNEHEQNIQHPACLNL